MKEKIFETKNGVELYVDFDAINYETSNIEEIRTALSEDINSKDAVAKACAREVLHIINLIDEIKNGRAN